MEVSFDVDINLDDENNESNDGCELHNDYDNQKLFDIYESYLKRSDASDSDSEPELSFDDQFYQLVTNKCSKTAINNRSIRQMSCLADIESQTPRISRQSSPNNGSKQSLEDSLEIALPWNLKTMNEQEIVTLGQSLEEEVLNNETDGPNIASNQMKQIYDKSIQFLYQMFKESENKFNNCLKTIELKSDDQRLDFNELIGKQLESYELNSQELTKLGSQLNVIKDICKK